MNRQAQLSCVLSLSLSLSLVACAGAVPPRTANGDYIPPPAEHPLEISLIDAPCDGPTRIPIVGPLITLFAPIVVNQAYDRFINWLDAKKAGLSSSSSGVATLEFYDDHKAPKGCLLLKRAASLEAKFQIVRMNGNTYWHMKPYSLDFIESEAKEGRDKPKSIVADISFAAPGADGKLSTFFQATFDLGKRTAGQKLVAVSGSEPFVGQDSGPFPYPLGAGKNEYVAMKVSASVIEHGEGRDWIRAVTEALKDKENRESLLKPILDAIAKVGGKTDGK